MKIAALIEVHHRPDLLARLLNRLAGELWAPYVHIDRKSDRSEFLPIVQHACFFDSVYSVRYSAFSQVLATLFLMKRALQDKSNTHFYLMSGQCFPIKTDVDIALTIVSDSGNYIEVYKMAQEFLFRLTEWRFRDHPIASSRIGSAIENKVHLFLPPRNVEKVLRGAQPYGGSAWWLLRRDAVAEIARFVTLEQWYLRAFRWSSNPEEMFFQTAAMYLGIVPDRSCPTFTKWIEKEDHPLCLTPDILQEAGWHLMARKFDRVEYLPT